MKALNPVVKIDKPCHEKWSSMSATEKGRFCTMCTKEVVDFTSSTNEEISAHLKQAEGSVCGRLYSSQVISSPKVSRVKYFFLKTKTYLVTLLAVISASALFGEKAEAQNKYPIKGKMKINRVPEQTTANTRETTVRGMVTLDNAKTPIPECKLTISSAGEIVDETKTNENGEYKVQLPPGTMQNNEVTLSATIEGCVDKTIENLKVLKDEITLNFSLAEEYYELGDMLYVPEPMMKMGEIMVEPGHDLTKGVEDNTDEPDIIEPKPGVQDNILEIRKDPFTVQKPFNIQEPLFYSMGVVVSIDPEPDPPVNITDGPDVIIMGDTTYTLQPETMVEPETIEGVPENADIDIFSNYDESELTNVVDHPENFVKTQCRMVEPVVWVNPFQDKEVKKIARVKKLRMLKKVRILAPVMIDETEEATQLLNANEGQVPIEVPAGDMLENREGTRETLEPINESNMILSAYPNPATDYFNIDLGVDGEFLLEMFDGQGRQVKITKLIASSSRIDTSNLEPGTYLVSVSNPMGDQVETKTIIVL